jgi:hypothetical protein
MVCGQAERRKGRCPVCCACRRSHKASRGRSSLRVGLFCLGLAETPRKRILHSFTISAASAASAPISGAWHAKF